MKINNHPPEGAETVSNPLTNERASRTNENPSPSSRAVYNDAIKNVPLPVQGSSSIQQVDSSAASQSDIQKLLTPQHWKEQYITAAKKSDPKKANGAYGELMSSKKYWTDYSGNGQKKSKTTGTGRTNDQVKKLINDPSSHLNHELDARKNKPSLTLYKSLPTDRKELGGGYQLGGHFGDYEQAEKYYKGNQGQEQTMLKITLKPGAHELLFSPNYMALAPEGKQHRTLAELSKLEGKGEYPLASKNEGYLPGYIGLKAEGDSGFSLGFKQGNKGSEDLFNHFVATIEEGRPGKDGKFEPTPSTASDDAEPPEN